MALTKISTAGVKDDAVTNAKIADDAIDTPQIADGAVDTINIADQNVDTAKITNNAVTTAKIADNAITTGKIAAGAVTGVKIAAEIDNSHITSVANIAGSKLADNSISLAKLEHGTSSNNGKFLRANNGADPTFETINTAITGDLDGGLNSNGYNLNFADSNGSQDMAKFGAGGDLKIYHDGTHSYIDSEVGSFYIRDTGGAERVRINGYGTAITGGLLFGSDTAASNALNDYEEGTWTVTMNKAGTTGNADSQVTTRSGIYTKVGDLLFISFYWYSNNLNFGTGGYQWYISGLPYNVMSNNTGAVQFIPGGYQYNNGSVTAYNVGNYRWQSNNTNGQNTLAMYGNMHTSNASGGAWEWSGCGCLRCV